MKRINNDIDIADAEFPAYVYLMKKSAQLHTLRKIFLGPLHLEV